MMGVIYGCAVAAREKQLDIASGAIGCVLHREVFANLTCNVRAIQNNLASPILRFFYFKKERSQIEFVIRILSCQIRRILYFSLS